MTIELDVLKQVCSQLDDHEIPYMLTGSFAANFYAVPRMTRDIDLVIEIQMKDRGKFFQLLTIHQLDHDYIRTWSIN